MKILEAQVTCPGVEQPTTQITGKVSFGSHDSTNTNMFQMITGWPLHGIIHYCYEKQILVCYDAREVFFLQVAKFYVVTDCDKNILVLSGSYL